MIQSWNFYIKRGVFKGQGARVKERRARDEDNRCPPCPLRRALSPMPQIARHCPSLPVIARLPGGPPSHRPTVLLASTGWARLRPRRPLTSLASLGFYFLGPLYVPLRPQSGHVTRTGKTLPKIGTGLPQLEQRVRRVTGPCAGCACGRGAGATVKGAL